MALAIGEPFNYPVDLTLYPDYMLEIEYPMDFRQILANILVTFFFYHFKKEEINFRKISFFEVFVRKCSSISALFCCRLLVIADFWNPGLDSYGVILG
jgi:hypothetical protein